MNATIGLGVMTEYVINCAEMEIRSGAEGINRRHLRKVETQWIKDQAKGIISGQ